MGRLEMLQAKRDEILDEISRHNRDVAKLREELDNVQYRIGIQRLLREKQDLLEAEMLEATLTCVPHNPTVTPYDEVK